MLGDLNASWEGVPHVLCERLDLQTIDHRTPTFTDLGQRRRLDWILASNDLEMIAHHVLPSGLSDHRAIVADVRLR